ncbi:ankyrin repeat and SOCS box protein 2 isoform X1 [Bufo gargarizans]|uniref:ankyrin repeat and SOCS box protein 2 isoform X1 n=1 Tax=Bufo gargarizans TaxID=30331 RepID=UPI001CF13CFB|nr:ankyrin repeat and SOCS box protein 2 isoform X1 [Bufo gargarizans]
MATRVSTSGPPQCILGSEEYSLYSSLSEEELIQMAIEQSLSDNSTNQPTGQHHQKQRQCNSVNAEPPKSSHRPPQNSNRSPQATAAQTQNPDFSTGVVRKRYDGSYCLNAKPVERNPIEEIIKKGDEEALSNLLKSGTRLCEPNKDGWLPMHEAAYYGSLHCLKLLLKAYPVMIDQRTLHEETALYLATVQGHLECIQFLLQSGAEPDIVNKSRETPLYKACERKNSSVVQMLVDYRSDVNHRCNQGWTALHEAVARNVLDIIDIMVKGGAKIEAKNCYGISPLFVAAQSGQLEALRYLLKCGADINTQANDSATALFEASKNGHDEIVEFLLAQGADANKQNKDGFLPIHIAAKKRDNDDIVSMLIPVTSRVRVKRSGISPLHIAAECNNDGVLEELINAGYDVNFTLSFDRARLYEDRRSTALYFSVMNNNIYATKLLLEAGANPNIDIINPLLISIRHGCITTMKMLLDHGANINAYISTHPTSFPATIMFSMKYLSLLKYIMDLGCDADSCFTCEYGSAPHPPVEDPRRQNDTPQDQKHPKIVQFCEMVSTPELSRWAGPIIDVLLDYVGNVQLCSRLQEHLDSYSEWDCIKTKAELPRPLTHLCRLKVRSLLDRNRLKLLDTLPLPGRLIRYLGYDTSNQS